MREIDREYHEPIVIIDESLRDSSLERLRSAVDEVRQEGDPIIYSNTSNALIRNGWALDRTHAFLTQGWNEGLLYQFISEHAQELGITLYRGVVEPHLDIEPGGHASVRLCEQLGYFLVEHTPKTFQRIKEAKTASFCRLDQCERGIVGTIMLDGELIVFKCTNSSLETEIAKHLSNLRLAPAVFESTTSVLVEEYILDFPVKRLLSHGPDFVGDSIGQALKSLHDQEVVYDNWVGSHVLVDPKSGKPPRMIDFESAYWGDDIGKDWESAEKEIREKIYRKSERKARKAIEAMSKWMGK